MFGKHETVGKFERKNPKTDHTSENSESGRSAERSQLAMDEAPDTQLFPGEINRVSLIAKRLGKASASASKTRATGAR